MATPSRSDALRADTFRQTTDSMAKSAGAKITLAAAEYRVKEHPFLRADFERNMGGQRILQTNMQTLAEDYLLTIEVYALSDDERQAAIDSLQNLAVADQ